MKTKSCITSTKKSHKAVEQVKHDCFVSVVLIHDQQINRMKSYMPLALLQIDDNNTLLDLQIKAIEKKFQKYEVIVTAGSHIEKIVRHIKQKYRNQNIRVIENTMSQETTNAESTRLSLNNINNDKIFIIDGHLFFTDKIFEEINPNESFVLCNREKDDSLEIGVNVGELDNVQYFSYGANFAWSEVIFLNAPVSVELEKILSTKQFQQKFLFEAINEMLKRTNIKQKYVDVNNVIKIKNNKTYQRARSRHEIHSR